MTMMQQQRQEKTNNQREVMCPCCTPNQMAPLILPARWPHQGHRFHHSVMSSKDEKMHDHGAQINSHDANLSF